MSNLNVKALLSKILTQCLTKNDLVVVDHTVNTALTISSGSSNNTTYSVTKAGYYPIGVVGWRIANGSGSGGSYGLPFGVYLSSAASGSASVRVGIRAVAGNLTSCTLIVSLLWRKI